MGTYSQNVITISHTATDDLKFNLSVMPMWFSEANIHVETADAKYGDMHAQDAVIKVNDVVSFLDLNLSELYFKNETAGLNTTVRVVGTLMPDGRRKSWGLP